jgi:hypothetical protein
VRRVRREVRLVMIEECGVPVRLMTMGSMSTNVPGQWLLPYGIGEGGVFGTNHLGSVGQVVVRAILPFPYLNLIYRGVSAASVRVADVARFEESDKVGFVRGGSQRR